VALLVRVAAAHRARVELAAVARRAAGRAASKALAGWAAGVVRRKRKRAAAEEAQVQ
jgi:hypothetical protein